MPVSAIILLLCTFAVPAQTPARTVLQGHQPAVVPSLTPLGRLDGSTRLKLSLHLPLHHRDELTALVDQIYDPASPSYHHYLAPDKFDAQFGPTAAEYQALIDFATRQGFTVTARHANRLLLEVSAPVTNIEHAFQVTMRIYRHPTEPRSFFAPDAEPSAEAGIPVAYIGGLDNFSRAHPQNLRRTPLKAAKRATPQNIGSGPNGNLAGFDYRAAYVPGSALTGGGQTVGLVEFDGYYPGDITGYENQTGVPNVPVQKVLLDGFDGIPTTGADSANGEVALDIELTVSMAPGLAGVVVFEDDPNTGLFNNVLQAMSENTNIKQFSCSWAFPSISQPQRISMDDYFLKFAAQGQSFFASSGDSGVYSGAVDAPDDDPYVTLAGGTALASTGPGGAWLSETAWNAQAGPGVNSSSGGISTSYSIPAWQKGVSMTANHGSTTWRNCPDVAMVADNIFIMADDGQAETTGGTSASAPLWAGFTALVNQQAVSASLPTVGFINPALYHLGTNSGFRACFDDVTIGNNTNTSTTKYLAVPGYDLCTGWGSPSGSSLINALTQPDGFQITPGRGFVANGPVGGPFTVSTQTLTLTNAGMPSFNWSVGTAPAWLNVSANPSILTAGGAGASVTLTLNAAASLLPAGVYTANLWFTNLTSGLTQLRQFTLQVNQDLVVDGGFETGDFSYWTLSGSGGLYTNNFVDFANDPDGTGYSPYAGDCFAAMGQISSVAYLSQTLPTQPGQLYQVSLWVENPAGGPPNQCQVEWSGGTTNTLFNQTNMGTFGWSNLVFNVQATTNLTTLKLGFRNGSDFFVLDDVSVLALPAPVITTVGSLPEGAFNVAYDQQLSATGSTAPYIWTLTAGSLPAGLGLGSGGLISGTPTAGAAANFIVTVTGQNGLSSTQAFSLKVTPPDTTPPTLVITTPKSGAKCSNDVFVVTGTAKDNVAVSNVLVSLNGPSWTPAALSNGNSNWTAQVILAPGTNTIAAYAVDTSGNISITSTAKLDYVLTTTLTVRTNGEGGISPAYNDATLLISNTYSLTAKADKGFGFVNWTDGNGNILTNGATFRFVMASNLTFVANFVDITPPMLTITSPKNGAKESNDTFIVTGTAKDNVAVSNVLVAVNGVGWTAAALTNGNWSTQVTLNPGTDTIAAYAVDTSGNVSITSAVKLDYIVSAVLTVETVGSGTLSPDYNNALLAIGTRYTMKAVAGKGFAFYFWSVDGTMSSNVSLIFTMTNDLAITANFKDVTPPTVTITEPTSKSRESNNVITVTGTANDNVGVVGVGVKINQGDWVSADGTNNWTATNLPVASGTNIVLAYAMDAAGNLSLTNEVKFIGAFPPDWATDTLAGLTVKLVPDAGDPVSVSLNLTNFNQTDLVTNGNSGVGSYQYAKDSTNTAELSLAFVAPLTLTNAGPQDIQLTWTNVATGVFTNVSSANTGTFSLLVATNYLPTSWSGHKITATQADGGGITTNSLTSSSKITIAATGASSTGTYEVMTASPAGVMLVVTQTTGTDAGKVLYLQLTFTSKTGGDYEENTFDINGNLTESEFGGFIWK